jgi:hypothetical protein
MLSLRLTYRELAEKGACEDALLFFQTEFPEGLFVEEWNALHYVIAASYEPYNRFLGWLVSSGLVPAFFGPGANLSRANLYGADLSRAILPDGFNS